MLAHTIYVVGRRVDAGTDGGRAHVDFADQLQGFLQSQAVLANHDGVGAELLAQRHRHGILQLSPPDFQHVPELNRFGLEGRLQMAHGVQ
ncbi:hypothetical protein D9M68_888180 [compost metagenome]